MRYILPILILAAFCSAAEEVQLTGKKPLIHLDLLLEPPRKTKSVTNEASEEPMPDSARSLTIDQQRMVNQLRENIGRRLKEAAELAEKDPAFKKKYEQMLVSYNRLKTATFLYAPHDTRDNSDSAYVSGLSASTVYLTPKFFKQPVSIGYSTGKAASDKQVQYNANLYFQKTIGLESVLLHEGEHLGQSGTRVLLPWNWGFFYFQKERSAYETQYIYQRLYGKMSNESIDVEYTTGTLEELEWYYNRFGRVGKHVDQILLVYEALANPTPENLKAARNAVKNRQRWFDYKFGTRPLPEETIDRLFNEFVDRERKRASAASGNKPVAGGKVPPVKNPPGGKGHWLIDKLKNDEIKPRPKPK